MFKIFGKQTTTKFDVIMAVAGGLVAVMKAADTVKEYRAQKDADINEEQK